MVPAPRPEEMARLSDREILLLTVQTVHDLSRQFETLAAEVRERAPSPREKKSLYAGAVMGFLALVGYLGDFVSQIGKGN